MTFFKRLILLTLILTLFPIRSYAKQKKSVYKVPSYYNPLYYNQSFNQEEDLYEKIGFRKDSKAFDFLAFQFFVLPFIVDEPSVQHGLLSGLNLKHYFRNTSQIKWHDGDSLETEGLHILAGYGMWAYFRSRDFTRWETSLAILGTGLWREWVWKTWGIAPSFDDPFIFAGSGIVLGLITEEILGVDHTLYDWIYPIVDGKIDGDEYEIYIGVAIDMDKFDVKKIGRYLWPVRF